MNRGLFSQSNVSIKKTEYKVFTAMGTDIAKVKYPEPPHLSSKHCPLYPLLPPCCASCPVYFSVNQSFTSRPKNAQKCRICTVYICRPLSFTVLQKKSG